MQVLTCEIGAEIRIGEDIKVTFMGIQGRHVCLGFTAPKSIAIHRHEHYQKFRARAQGAVRNRDE